MMTYIIRMVLTDKDIYNTIIKNIVLKPYSIKTLEKQISAEFRQLKFDIEKNVIRNAIREDKAFKQRMGEFQSVEYTYDLEGDIDLTCRPWTPGHPGANPMLKALHEVQEYRNTCKTLVEEKVKEVMAGFWAVSDEFLKTQDIEYYSECPTKLLHSSFTALGLCTWKMTVLKEVSMDVLKAEWDKYTFYCRTLRARHLGRLI